MDWTAIALTARLAACTTALLLVIGLPVAQWLATTRWRGRVFVEAVVALPLVLPPTVLGFYLLLLLGPHGWIGHWFEALFHSRLPFSFEGLLIGSVFYSLPFAVQPFTLAFRGVDPQWVEAARIDGASRWQAFRRVTLPLAWPGLLAGMALSFAHTLGEFGVALMIGGNIAGKTRTISIALYDEVQAQNYTAAAWTAFALLVCSFLILTLIYTLQGGWSGRSGGTGNKS